MQWVEISVRADGEAAEAVSELFNRLNSRPDGQGGAVTEVGGFDPVGDDHRPFVTVRTYLSAGEPDAADRQRQIEEGLWFLGRIYPLSEPQIRPLAEEDWANAWKASYRPLHVGRFLIIPEWERDSVQPAAGELPIVLDPGMAFGTGLHPSTQLCLRLMPALVKPGMRVLDAGCGSGILSIAAARLGAGRVDAFDIDPIAVTATQENAALNDLPVPIHVVQSEGPNSKGPLWNSVNGVQPQWRIILVNILPHIILSLFEAGLHQHLAPDGCLVLAGIVQEREADVLAGLERHGLEVVYKGRVTDGDWVALVAQRHDDLAIGELPPKH